MVVGDGMVGKTCMIMCYAQDSFPSGHIPTIMDAYTGTDMYEGKQVALEIYDTAGQQDYAAMRPVVYMLPTPTQCFIVCFSLVDPQSFNNAKTVWLNEIS